MKKGKLVRVLCTMLVLVLMTALVACGQTPSEQSSNNTPASSPESADAAPKEVTTLEVFSMFAPSQVGLVDSWWQNVLKENVGVQLDIISGGDQPYAKLQTLMAGGELPDITIFRDNKDIIDAIKANMLMSLDDYADSLPNVFTNAPIALQYYRDNVSNGTGKAYCVADTVGPGEVEGEVNAAPFINWNLYKELGMPEVQTLEDYLPLLKQMQDLQPTNKDGKKVYGLSLFKSWDGFALCNAAQIGCWQGIEIGDFLSSLPFLQVDVSTGETMSYLSPDSQYIRALRFFYEANQMGLLDPDSLTQDWDTCKQKATDGRALMGFWWWYFDEYNVTENNDADPPTGFRPVLSGDCKPFWFGNYSVGKDRRFAISSATKNLDACLRYLDYLYSTDGLQILFNGPQGVTWDINDQGQPYITDEGWDCIDNQKELPGGGLIGEGVNVVNAYGLSHLFINPKTNEPLNYKSWTTSKTHNISALMKDWQDTTGYKTTADMLQGTGQYTYTTFPMQVIPAMTDDISALKAQVGDVVTAKSWEMIYAKNDAEFDQVYNEMVEQAEGLGLQQILDWDLATWQQAQDIAQQYVK